MKSQILLASLLCVALCAPSSLVQATPNWRVKIQPIHICNTDGTSCVNPQEQVWEAVGDKIWAQAGIDLHFLPWSFVYDDALYDHHLQGETMIAMAGDPATYGGSTDPTVLNMWFAPNLLGDGTTQGGAVFLNWPYILSQGENGQQDVPFHEVGHALGIIEHYTVPDPDPLGNDKSSNLMAGGEFRKRYEGIENIYPDGLGRDRLEHWQIDLALTSPKVQPIPEPPAALLMFSVGAAAVVCRGCRKG
jgi:hypothetical protein